MSAARLFPSVENVTKAGLTIVLEETIPGVVNDGISINLSLKWRFLIAGATCPHFYLLSVEDVVHKMLVTAMYDKGDGVLP